MARADPLARIARGRFHGTCRVNLLASEPLAAINDVSLDERCIILAANLPTAALCPPPPREGDAPRLLLPAAGHAGDSRDIERDIVANRSPNYNFKDAAARSRAFSRGMLRRAFAWNCRDQERIRTKGA